MGTVASSTGVFLFCPPVGDQSSWEGEPLTGLAAAGELMAFEHTGFWQPMDTLRDKNLLEELWQAGSAPWKVW